MLSELKYRKSRKALEFYKRLACRLAELSVMEAKTFKWPTTAVIGDTTSALKLAHFDYEEGLLKFMGYAVEMPFLLVRSIRKYFGPGIDDSELFVGEDVPGRPLRRLGSPLTIATLGIQ